MRVNSKAGEEDCRHFAKHPTTCPCVVEGRTLDRRRTQGTRELLVRETVRNANTALVRGFNLSYHNKETILFTLDPHYGNLN